MNLKEQLEAKKAELKGLEASVKEGNEEAIKSSTELMEEIERLDDLVKKAEKAEKMLENIGKDEKAKAEEDEMTDLHLEDLKTEKGSRSFEMKAYNDNEAMGLTRIADTDKNVVDPQPELTVRGLFGAETISGNALTYFVTGSLEGTIGVVNEGAAKNQIHIPYEAKTVALEKVAAFMKETDELLSDAAFLETALRNRGIYEFRKAVEENLVDSLIASGVQAGQSTISFDNILKAKQAVRTATGYAPDALLINPADLETLLLSKDSNQQYLLGGPAYGSYGNGAYAANPRIWGLNVVESQAVPEGAAIVGAFKAGASVVTKAGEGLRAEVSNSDQDDFIKNRVTVRIEERMVLATRVPDAFVLVGTVASSS